MGGAIASAYAARNPDRLKKLTLLASAGMMHNLGFLAKAAKFPIFGRFLFLLFYGLLHKRSTEKERKLISSVPNIVERQQNELQFKGFHRQYWLVLQAFYQVIVMKIIWL